MMGSLTSDTVRPHYVTITGDSTTIGSIVPLTQTLPAWNIEYEQQPFLGNMNVSCQAPSQPRSTTMTHDLKTANLTTLPLDDLLMLSATAKFLVAEYVTVKLEVPDWLAKRQKDIKRAITAALEKDIEAAEAELKALEDKEVKRQAHRDRIAQLRQALGQ